VKIMGRQASADWSATAESGVTHYFEEIRRLPMLEPQQEYLLAKLSLPKTPSVGVTPATEIRT
jgi:hypothetical protein